MLRRLSSHSSVLLFVTLASGCSIIGGFSDFEDAPADDNDGSGGSDMGGTNGDGSGGSGTGGSVITDGSGGVVAGTGGAGKVTQKPKLTDCQAQGPVFTILEAAEIDPKADLSQVEFTLASSDQGAYFATLVTVVDTQDNNQLISNKVFGRFIPDSGPLGNLAEQDATPAPTAGGQVRAAKFDGGRLKIFGQANGAVREWDFEQTGPGLVSVNVTGVPDFTCIAGLNGASLRKVVFDLPSEQYIFVCEVPVDFCGMGTSLCRDGLKGCSKEEDCCEGARCDRKFEMHASTSPADVIGTLDEAERETDLTFELRSYVYNDADQLLLGEFSPQFRSGQALSMVKKLRIREEGSSYVLSAVPGPNNDGAILFAVDSDVMPLTGSVTPDFLVGPKTFEVARLVDKDFATLHRSPLEIAQTSFDLTQIEYLPQTPIVGSSYIALASENVNLNSKVAFSLYERDGILAVDRQVVYEAPPNAKVENTIAATTDTAFARVVVAWRETDPNAVTSIRGQRYACNP